MTRVLLNQSLVILVDDGIATGMTAMAAMKSLKAMGAGKIILATPVIPDDTYKMIREIMKEYCSLIVSLLTPVEFTAVGNFYNDFHQVEQDELVACLKSTIKHLAAVSNSSILSV